MQMLQQSTKTAAAHHQMATLSQGLDIAQQLSAVLAKCSLIEQHHKRELSRLEADNEHAQAVQAVLKQELPQQKSVRDDRATQANSALEDLKKKEAELEAHLEKIRDEIDLAETESEDLLQLNKVEVQLTTDSDNQSAAVAKQLEQTKVSSEMLQHLCAYLTRLTGTVQSHYVSQVRTSLTDQIRKIQSILDGSGEKSGEKRKRHSSGPIVTTDEQHRQAVILLEQVKMVRNSCPSSMLADRIGDQLDSLQQLCCQLRGAEESAKSTAAYKGARTAAAMFAGEQVRRHAVPNWHVEQPSRTVNVEKRVREISAYKGNKISLHDVELAAHTSQLLPLVHQPGYLHFLNERSKAVKQSGDRTTELRTDGSDFDTFISPDTYDAALVSASVVCAGVDQVLTSCLPLALS